MVRVYTDADADLAALSGRTVAVIGFGNQGAAQSQNLRDSGIPVVVGNRDDEYRKSATAAGFEPIAIADAARAGQVVLLLIPDEVQPAVFSEQIAPHLAAGDTLVVASGYNVTFGLLDIPDDVDVVMVAPRMIGAAVRSRFQSGAGYPCFVSVERDTSGGSLNTALAIARGIGGTVGGAIASSAREEAALDLFSEQALWPTLIHVLRTAYDVLHDAGFSDEAVLYEMYLSAEPAEIFAAAAESGLFEQLRLHSQTSQYGQLRALHRLTEDRTGLPERFASVLHDDILSGKFSTEWSRLLAGEDDSRLDELRHEAAQWPLAVAERAVREQGQTLEQQ